MPAPLFRAPDAGRFAPQDLRFSQAALVANLAFFGQDTPRADVPSLAMTMAAMEPDVTGLTPALTLGAVPLVPNVAAVTHAPASFATMTPLPPIAAAIDPYPHDVLIVFDQLSEDTGGRLLDRLVVGDSFSVTVRLSAAVVDTVRAVDQLGVVASAVSVDTLVIQDSLLTPAVSPPSLRDGLIVADRVILSGHLSAAIANVVRVRDSAKAIPSPPLLADTLKIIDALAISTHYNASAMDVVQIADAISVTVKRGGSIADVLRAIDEVSATAYLAATVADTVIVRDALIAPFVQYAVVTNLESGAASLYRLPVAVNSLAEYNGTLYLAGPAGLYALDSTRDESGAIVWTLQTGFTNLGTDLLKRVRDVNLQLRAEGDVTLQIVSDRIGIKQEHHYRLTPLERESYRDGVIKVGRGIQSVYCQLELKGAGPAEIDQMRIAVEPLSRRR